jgi:hypothetical protein
MFRWGFVTHAAVDGYSRFIPYLSCETNNRAQTVLKLFVQASVRYGLPSRARSDHGGENIKVALFLNLLRGEERNVHLTGKSVHNQRIERMWRDVHQQVTSLFYNEFYSMEDGETALDVRNPQHLFALQYVYKPVINQRFGLFKSAWNSHRLRTEGHRTPEQLWIDGMLHNIEGSREYGSCRAFPWMLPWKQVLASSISLWRTFQKKRARILATTV